MPVSRREQVGDDVSGNAEQSGMTKRHQSGIADQNVEPEREYCIEQNLTGDIDVINFLDRVWQHHQDQHHRQEQNEISKLRKKRLAEIVDESNHDTADEGAKKAPGAAEDDDDQRERQHVLVDARVDRKNWPSDQAGETSKSRAQRKDNREQSRYPDADHSGHLRVVHAGANHRTKTRSLQHEP